MFTLTLKSIRANKVRFVLTAVAVILGVAFMAGTLVLTDTIKQTYDNLAGHGLQGHRRRRAFGQHGRVRWPTTRGTVDAARARPGPQRPRRRGGRAASARRRRWSSATTASCSTAAATGRSRSASAGRTTPQLNPMELVDGHAPRSPPTRSSSTGRRPTRVDFAVGDTIRVLSQIGSAEYRLAGIATYGGADDAAGAQVVAFTPRPPPSVLGDARPLRRDPRRRRARRVAGRARRRIDRRRSPTPNVEVITGAAATPRRARHRDVSSRS